MTQSSITLRLTEDEAGYLSGMIAAQKTKLEVLDKRVRTKEPIKNDVIITNSLEKKLLAVVCS